MTDHSQPTRERTLYNPIGNVPLILYSVQLKLHSTYIFSLSPVYTTYIYLVIIYANTYSFNLLALNIFYPHLQILWSSEQRLVTYEIAEIKYCANYNYAPNQNCRSLNGKKNQRRFQKFFQQPHWVIVHSRAWLSALTFKFLIRADDQALR